MFLVTQALQFMDKTSLNYANLFGYQEALGLKGKEFNYLSASQFPPPMLTNPIQLFCQIHSLIKSHSGVCWLLLRAVPLWLVNWKVSSPEGHGH